MKHHPNLLRTNAWRFLIVCAFVVALPGCSFGNIPTQLPAAPTQNLAPTLQAVQTEAAQTVVANLTANAPTPTLVAATETQAPTATNTAEPPTAVPSFTAVPATATKTATLVPVFTSTPVNTGCSITSQNPAYLDKLKRNSDFDGKWVVKNTGSKTWAGNEVDIRYAAGTKFQTKVDILDLGTDVAAESSKTIIIDMKTPDKVGTFSTTWVIATGSTVYCTMSITIRVTD